MDVRCPGCGRAVSEWAARCPRCGSDLAEAEPVAGERVRPTARRRRPLVFGTVVSGAVVAGAVVAVVALLAVAITVARSGGDSGHGHRPASSTTGVRPAPGDLGAQRLFIADGQTTEALLGDGAVLERIGPSTGDHADPVAVGHETAVFVRRGEAYDFDAATGHDPVPLGPADEVIAAGPGRVDLVTTVGGREFVNPTTVGGVGTGPTFEVPANHQVVGLSQRGLVLETPDRDLEVPGGDDAGIVTGPVSRVVAVAGDEIAWTSVTGCNLALTGDCPLHLTDLADGITGTVTSTGVLGFAGVGALSPDGKSLAVYSLPSHPQSAARLDLSVVTVATGVVRQLGSVLVSGTAMPTVTWSPSGEWLFFGGAGSFDALDLALPDGSEASGGPVPVPISPTCCVVGF